MTGPTAVRVVGLADGLAPRAGECCGFGVQRKSASFSWEIYRTASGGFDRLSNAVTNDVNERLEAGHQANLIVVSVERQRKERDFRLVASCPPDDISE